MSRGGRIVLMPGNNALGDARVMKNLHAAAELGYEAIALGISLDETVREVAFDWGGRVVVQPVYPRLELWRRYRRTRLFMDRADRAVGTALVAHLKDQIQAENERARRNASRTPAVRRPPRAPSPWQARRRWLRWAVARVVVKARSILADREMARDRMDPVALEAWRQRQFRLLALTPWRTAWRRALPKATDEMIDLLPRLEELDPDIIHVHDVYMMATAARHAARHAARAAARGRTVKLVYDAREYVPGLAHVPPKRVAAYSRMEAEHMPDFDHVVTVSQALGELLTARHGLVREPDVVLNAPMLAPLDPGRPTVRQAAGLDPDTPLLVYGGVVNPARGLQTAVKALPLLPGVHLALVVNNRGAAIRHLVELAGQLGAAERLHLVDYAPHDQVVAHIADADIGLSPLSHVPNHDVAITNKFCEYIAAGLPVVTSDTPAQAELVADLDIGAVFQADNPQDLARAVAQTLQRRPQLAKRLADDPALRHRFTWAAQTQTLARIYAELLGHD
jgi:glycosyltransferase involved in cell wall biosynthesis